MISYRRPRVVARRRQQQGMALIFGMIILLILTLIGITAVRGTTQQQRMAAATQQQVRTFEAAESSVHYAMAQLDPDSYPGAVKVSGDVISDAQLAQLASNQVDAMAPTIPSNAVVVSPPGADPKIPTSARVYGIGQGPYSMAGYSLNGYNFYRFFVDATAGDPGSASAVRNIQEVTRPGPK